MNFPIRIGVQLQPQHSPQYSHVRDAVRRCEDIGVDVAFDIHGNMWISTDSTRAMDINDGLYAVALDGPNRGETKLFLTVPIGAETCGPVVTDVLVTVCVQHPGEGDDNTIDKPLSHWPGGGDTPARPSVVAVWKPDGNIGV